MSTTLKIACLRARMNAAHGAIRRAIDILVAAGVAFAAAVRYSLSCARAA